jgi:cell division protein FtsI (penicillin-binding protein 3)
MVDHKPGGYGTITVREAFEKSSNIAISRMINDEYGLEPRRFIEFIKNLGLMQPLGFQLAGEGMPYIKSPDDPSWSGISLPWMSIGYELRLTPLQVLSLYNAVANQGKMIQPIIVKQSKKADEVINKYQPAIINSRICSKKTLNHLRSLLEGVVDHGTASNIKNSHYKIAGKTGTAQKVKAGGGYSKKYYTSFVGYFPADAPRFSCIVVIDNPKSFNQYGSDVAAPVFKTIADKIYSLDIELHQAVTLQPEEQKGVFPVIQAGNQGELAMICNAIGIKNIVEEEAEWVKAKIANEQTITWKENEYQSGLMPDVTGMRLRDALYLLENAGLRVSYSGKGRISSQSIAANTKIKKGSTIKLDLEEWPY